MATAASLPFFLLTLPAGALADMVERKRMLCAVNLWLPTPGSAPKALQGCNSGRHHLGGHLGSHIYRWWNLSESLRDRQRGNLELNGSLPKPWQPKDEVIFFKAVLTAIGRHADWARMPRAFLSSKLAVRTWLSLSRAV
jgi:Transmembrane secretion effector